MTAAQTDLKPCPFCGGSATFVVPANGSGEYVMCNGCGMATLPQSSCISKWNTRLAPIKDLSRRQKQIYAFVVEYIATSDQSPTWQEIADGLEFKTKDQAFNCAKPLFKRGILGKSESAARSIQVLIQSENVQ